MIVQSQPKNKKKFALWITVKWAFVAQNYKTPEMCSFHIKQQFELKHKLLNNFSPTAGDLLLRAESPINLSHEIKPLFSCVPFDIHRRWDRNSREAFRQVPWWLHFVSLSSCIISEKNLKLSASTVDTLRSSSEKKETRREVAFAFFGCWVKWVEAHIYLAGPFRLCSERRRNLKFFLALMSTQKKALKASQDES